MSSKPFLSIAFAIKANEPTVNGNIYPEAALHKMVQQFNSKTILVYADADSAKGGGLKESQGVVTAGRMESGTVVIDIEPINLSSMLHKLDVEESFKATSFGVGRMDEDRIIRDFTLKAVYLTPKKEQQDG